MVTSAARRQYLDIGTDHKRSFAGDLLRQFEATADLVLLVRAYGENSARLHFTFIGMKAIDVQLVRMVIVDEERHHKMSTERSRSVSTYGENIL